MSKARKTLETVQERLEELDRRLQKYDERAAKVAIDIKALSAYRSRFRTIS